MTVAFPGSRYGEAGQGDYLNCPMNEEEYRAFYTALLEGERVRGRDFEQERHFEGCMPVEALAERGERTLAFGPLKPVGFIDPRTGRRPCALLQLRPETVNRTMYNLVGCQTKLTYAAQAAVFRRVPGLERAEFVRFGSMHRNTYVNAPAVLNPDLSLVARPHVHLAGQITGVEGYVESLACGLWVGMLLSAALLGRTLAPPPPETALGALLGHLATPTKRFQPSNAHFGLMPEPEARVKKGTARPPTPTGHARRSPHGRAAGFRKCYHRKAITATINAVWATIVPTIHFRISCLLASIFSLSRISMDFISSRKS